MSTAELTLYTAKVCPFAQRVEIAFAEAGSNVAKYQIDLKNKPEWYAPKVNPASKVPAIAYGGPKVDPADPSPESTKIAESLVLLEFVADLYPSAALLPADPVQRAQVRFFIDAVSTKFLPSYFALALRGESPEKVYAALADVQALLSPAGFAVGDKYTIADAAIAPFLGRADIMLKRDLGRYEPGVGAGAYKEIFETPKFARLQKYYADVSARPSWKATFDEDYLVDYTKRVTFGGQK
ncbi:glutathione S-transferase [Auriscalpium vulgare]|uniref:Glutathione S-transferase n=1 Tax=Auriscalpium vulgare TaxID=40419 RepID=A0ACB8RYJ0_9AGAM|nr:glutathione S-transferase [Auriscalpium vulgare]